MVILIRLYYEAIVDSVKITNCGVVIYLSTIGDMDCF